MPSHAAYVLDDNMAKTPENVYNLLDKLWTPALKMAKQEESRYAAN
jgi:peptidyl-dipeptidase Dcp